MIYFAAPDGFLVALDAKTGKVRWETKVDEGGTSGGRHPRRRRQGDHQPDLHNRASARICFIAAHDAQDRQGGLEVLHHRGARRARRRHLGQHAGGAARRRSLGPARLLRSQAQECSIGASPIPIPTRG